MGAAASALIPVSSAGAGVAKEVSKVLTGDLVVISGRVFRVVEHQVGRKKEKFLEPVEVEAHVNPISLGLGALAVGAAVVGISVAAWLAGIGVEHDPVIAERIDERKRKLADLRIGLAKLEALPPDPAIQEEIANFKAKIEEILLEIRELRKQLLRLAERPRMGRNLFRIF